MDRHRRAKIRQSYSHPLLWMLQGWLAMFYSAAGYAKLTQERELMVYMLKWPGYVGDVWVKSAGVIEILAALCVLTPLVSWRLGGPVLRTTLCLMSAYAVGMGAFHVMAGDVFYAVVNGALATIAVTTLLGRSVADGTGMRSKAACAAASLEERVEAHSPERQAQRPVLATGHNRRQNLNLGRSRSPTPSSTRPAETF